MNRFKTNYKTFDDEGMKEREFLRKSDTFVGLPLGDLATIRAVYLPAEEEGGKMRKELYDNNNEEHRAYVATEGEPKPTFAVNVAIKIEGKWYIKYLEMMPSQVRQVREIEADSGKEFQMKFWKTGTAKMTRYNVQVSPKNPVTPEDMEAIGKLPMIRDLRRAAVDLDYLREELRRVPSAEETTDSEDIPF